LIVIIIQTPPTPSNPLFFFRTVWRVVEQMNALDAQKRVGVSP
jgi:hypothetical protein